MLASHSVYTQSSVLLPSGHVSNTILDTYHKPSQQEQLQQTQWWGWPRKQCSSPGGWRGRHPHCSTWAEQGQSKLHMYLLPPILCVCTGMATDQWLLCWLLQLLQTGISCAISPSLNLSLSCCSIEQFKPIITEPTALLVVCSSTNTLYLYMYVECYLLSRHFHYPVFKNVNEYNTFFGDELCYIIKQMCGKNNQAW